LPLLFSLQIAFMSSLASSIAVSN